MAQKRIILAFVCVLLLLAALVAWRQRPVPAAVRLELTGTPGLPVSGDLVVDGVSQKFSGELPATIKATARAFDYTIRMAEPHGELRGELLADERVIGSSSIANDYSGVRGSYSQTWTSEGGGFTVVRKGQ